MERYQDWLRQARRKLEAAKWNFEGKLWEEAAFSAHQAAELAAKALLVAKKLDHRGHAVSRLLAVVGAPADIVDMAREIDHHYINARYPDAYDIGAPMEFYTKNMAKNAIDYAEQIIKYIESEIGKLRL